jgi:uroporphyrinogen III methyltransferase/synthase
VRAEPDAEALEAERAGAIDAVTFTSSSTVDNFLAVVGALPEPQPMVVSIGPITSKTIAERGLRVDAEASDHDLNGLIRALLDVLSG